MEALQKMREIEKEYKRFFTDTGFRTSDTAITFNEFQSVIQSYGKKYESLNPDFLSESLPEEQYFQNKMDIGAIQHYRYMPAVYHTHEFFELACVFSGNFTNHIGKQKIELHAGDIFILSPNTQHAVCTYEEDAVMVNILIRTSTFEQHFMKILPDNGMLYNFFVKTLYGSSDTPYLLFKTGNDSVIFDYIQQILYEFRRNKRYKNTMMSSLLSIFFVTLLRRHEKDVIIPNMRSSVMNENTIFIIQYMQQNYATITLAHLAEFFNYSERQMQRIITTVTGHSFSENIKKIRMNHAAGMLANPDLTVQEIADLLGYYDSSNFRQVFKSYYKMTPQQYRENLKQNSL